MIEGHIAVSTLSGQPLLECDLPIDWEVGLRLLGLILEVEDDKKD